MRTMILMMLALAAVLAQAQTNRTAKPNAKPKVVVSQPAYTDPRIVNIEAQLKAIPAERAAAELACRKAGVPASRLKSPTLKPASKSPADAALQRLASVDVKEAELRSRLATIKAQRAKYGK